MDTSQFLLSPIGSLPCSPSPLAARFRDTFDLPASCKSEFAENLSLSLPPPFCESSLRFASEKSTPRSHNPYRQEMMSTSPPRLRRTRTLDLEADQTSPYSSSPSLSSSPPSSGSSSRSPSPPPYGYCETFDDDDEEDISAEEHAILAARARAVHGERIARYHEQELSFRIRSLRSSRSQPSSPSSASAYAQGPFAWFCSQPQAIEDPVTEAEYRRARAEVRRRRRSERMRVVELGSLLDARRAKESPPQTPPPAYGSESALGLGLGVAAQPTQVQADQIVARMILKRRESASVRSPGQNGLEKERTRSSSSLRFEALSL